MTDWDEVRKRSKFVDEMKPDPGADEVSYVFGYPITKEYFPKKNPFLILDENWTDKTKEKKEEKEPRAVPVTISPWDLPKNYRKKEVEQR